MSIELILFGVIIVVLALDFVLKGIKRKKTQDDVERIGEEQSKKKRFNFNYILKRKRNILSFILLAILLKPLINFQFFTEEEKFINTEKKFPAPEKRKDFIALANINHDVVNIYKTHFKVKKYNRDKTDENCTSDNCRLYFDYIPIKSLLKRYAIKADGIEPIRTNSKGDTILFFKNNLYYDNSNQWKVFDDINKAPDYTNFIIYEENYFGISPIAKSYLTGCKPVECELKNIKYKSKVNRNSRLFVKKSHNSRYPDIFTMMQPMVLDNGEFFLNKNGEVVYNAVIMTERMENEWKTTQKLNENGYQQVWNYQFVEINDRYTEPKYSASFKILRSVKFSNMYMDPNTKLLYDSDGNQVILEKDGASTNFYIHPFETRKTDIKNHFDNIFKTKHWLFAVSFASLLILTFLFNDKIKAR